MRTSPLLGGHAKPAAKAAVKHVESSDSSSVDEEEAKPAAKPAAVAKCPASEEEDEGDLCTGCHPLID